MKKLILPIVLNIFMIVGLFAQTTLFYDAFNNTDQFTMYNKGDMDLTAINFWQCKPTNWTSALPLFLPNQSTGAMTFESNQNTTGVLITNDTKAENAYISLKTPFSTMGGTKLFMSMNHLFFSPAAEMNDHGVLELSKDSIKWVMILDIQNTTLGKLTALMPDSFANQAKVWYRLRYVGNYSGIWTVDDIKFYIPAPSDIRLNAVLTGGGVLKKWFKNGVDADVTFNITNLGGDTVKKVALTYNINGNSPQTDTAVGLSIAPFATANITHPIKWKPVIDGFANALNGITGNVNGIVDASVGDNIATRNVVVYTNSVKRKPLYEVFTSSTCGPCTPGNANFHNIVDANDPTSFIQIKYQQDFPGNGDPYATNETVNRRSYYAINSIPRMEINGEWDGNANAFTAAIDVEANTIPATFELNPTCYMDVVDSMFYVTLKYKALNTVTASQYKAYAVICESTTKNNVGTNLETEFYYVAKKMIPDQNGTTLTTATLNVFDSLNVIYDLNGAYKLAINGLPANRINLSTNHSIENFNNLYLVTWLQHTSTKIVVQANSSKITLKSKPTSITNVEIVNSFSIAPNPASNFATISLNSTKNGLMTFEVYNVVGEKMMNIDANVSTGANKIDMNLQAIPNGNYFVKVLSNNTEIATEKFVVIK